jgi:hypothetical protein
LHNFSTTSSLLEHGVGESFSRATDVGLVSDFGCLADGRPEPRHLFCFFLLPISLSLSLSLNDNQKLFLLRRLPDRARRDLRDPSSLKKRSRLLIPFPLLALSAIVLVCRHK